MWHAQIDHFRADHRVIAADLRGFGNSTIGGNVVTMSEHAEDLAGILDALGVDEPVVFCGLSMGGYIGWRFYDQFPDRVRALILCDTRAAADTTEVARGRELMAAQVRHEGMQFVIDAMLPKLIAETTAASNQALVNTLTDMIRNAPPAGVSASQLGMAQRPDSSKLLGNIAVPTLLIVGQHDVISTAAEMHAMADAIPAAQFVEIPAAGHMTPMENPTATNTAIRDFLAMLQMTNDK